MHAFGGCLYSSEPMAVLIDSLYALAAVTTAPIWLTRMIRSGKIRTDWAGRFGAAPFLERGDRNRILIHAVSVGEVNAVRLLVADLASRQDPPQLIIATTTDTGFARATDLYAQQHHVVRYPLDFSVFVRRFLNRIRPDLVVLVELEVWPNFTAASSRRAIPVCVINGRLTERSVRRYRRILPLVRPTFRRLTHVAAQDEQYADRFESLGVPRDRISITGTMKWDSACITDQVDAADRLAEEMGIDRARPLVVAGSTAPDEHRLLHEAVPEGVQLLCAPRRPEWFDQAAADLPGCARRSRGERGSAAHRFLLDTIGELRAAYALADVVVVGRSFGNLHGSDMMEPVALGKPTIVGPAVSDFQRTVDALLAGDGIIQTDRDGLGPAIAELLENRDRAHELVEHGRAVIRREQGATKRHVDMLLAMLGRNRDQEMKR
jgi:3-deoxy-D-manno-octulosonic-acid transferase